MENHDHLKLEDRMEVIMMMQQMDKIPEFCSAYNDLSPPSDFSTTDPNCLECLQQASDFLPSTVEQPSVLAATAPLAAASRWRNSSLLSHGETEKQRSVAAMREMIFRMAVMQQPIQIDPKSVKAPKRKNVKISTDPQSVAARHRRERISERIRILQRLVPGGTKMDTASMLDEAIHYVKFLKSQVQSLQRAAANRPISSGIAAAGGVGFPLEIMSSGIYVPMAKPSPFIN